jgi:dTDP-glucose 4,6-dehydratase
MIESHGQPRRLLVTGGAGFIGSTFVRRRLAATNDRITVVDKLTYAGNPANLAGLDQDPATRDRYRFVHADIADEPLMRELVAECDAIVNFAAESHVDRSILEPAAFLHTGVMGVYALLEAARVEHDRRTSATPGTGDAPRASDSPDAPRLRFVQVSTDEVYGPVPEGLSVESDPMRPTSPYSAAKAAGEHLVAAYHETHGLDTVITRGANTYGPHQYPEKLIPLFITNALDDLPLPMYGDGLQRRDWLFVADHADGIAAALDHGQSGAAYNIPGDGVERPNRAVTEAILTTLDKPWSLVRSVPDRPGHDRRYALDGSRLRGLGWQPQVSFEDGLAQTIAWYREHRDWWEPIKSGEWADYYRAQYAWRLERSTDA